jgi:hypothetical protein
MEARVEVDGSPLPDEAPFPPRLDTLTPELRALLAVPPDREADELARTAERAATALAAAQPAPPRR